MAGGYRRWEFVFVCGHGAMEVKCQGCVLGSIRSLLDHKQKQIPIFHRTVLEGHWELEAETGTRMTARTCTFRSFRLFLHEVTHFFEN